MAKILDSKFFTYRFAHAVAMFFIVTIMCMGLLSMMRSDSQAIDDEIAHVQSQIEVYEKEYRELERTCAAMMSPKAVHAYAVKQLGMTRVSLAGVVHLETAGSNSGTATASLRRNNL